MITMCKVPTFIGSMRKGNLHFENNTTLLISFDFPSLCLYIRLYIHCTLRLLQCLRISSFVKMTAGSLCFLFTLVLAHQGSAYFLDFECVNHKPHQDVFKETPWMAFIASPTKNCSGTLINKRLYTAWIFKKKKTKKKRIKGVLCFRICHNNC